MECNHNPPPPFFFSPLWLIMLIININGRISMNLENILLKYQKWVQPTGTKDD